MNHSNHNEEYYKSKYLKYKSKYINLVQESKIGGSQTKEEYVKTEMKYKIIDRKKELLKLGLELNINLLDKYNTEVKLIQLPDTCGYSNCRIYTSSIKKVNEMKVDAELLKYNIDSKLNPKDIEKIQNYMDDFDKKLLEIKKKQIACGCITLF